MDAVQIGALGFQYLLKVFVENSKKEDRRWGTHPVLSNRLSTGTFHVMFENHRKYEDKFFQYYRMSVNSFDELLLLSLYIFGRDVAQIPCFRNSFLYGISGGIGCGLMHFLFTSKVAKSNHVAFGGFCGITMTYWFYCRYEFSKKQAELDEVKEYLQKRVLLEGTEMEKIHVAEVLEVKNKT